MSNKIAVLFLLCAAAVACKKPISESGVDEIPAGTTVISVQHLKTLYKGYPVKITDDYVFEAQVISTDSWGSFTNSIILEDATGGIEIKVQVEDEYSGLYNLWRKVTVRCSGLTLGSYGGSIQLGWQSPDGNYECGLIPKDSVVNYLIKDTEPGEERDPVLLTPEQLSVRYVNCYVMFSDVQIVEEDLGKTWGDTEGYAERVLEFRYSDILLPVRVSSAEWSAGMLIPTGSGSIGGILQVFNGKYSLRMNVGLSHNLRGPRF